MAATKAKKEQGLSTVCKVKTDKLNDHFNTREYASRHFHPTLVNMTVICKAFLTLFM